MTRLASFLPDCLRPFADRFKAFQAGLPPALLPFAVLIAVAVATAAKIGRAHV